MNSYHSRRSRTSHSHVAPFVAFLLIASFGILFAGCGKQTIIKGPDAVDDFTFTEQDLERFQRLAGTGSVVAGTGAEIVGTEAGTDAAAGIAPDLTAGSGAVEPPVLDLSMVKQYDTMRSLSTEKGNVYRVTNVFLNVRGEPKTTSANVARLNRGDSLTVEEFVNAGWAKVQLADGKKGYVSLQYIAKMTTGDKLEQEKKAFEGLYFVHFGFVNVRAKPEQQSEKLGQIDGQAFVRPLKIEGKWAQVSFQGKDGFISMDYISPFLPQFVVRQERFILPILRYNVSQEGVLQALTEHAGKLKQEGVTFLTFRNLHDRLLQGETVTFPPKSVIIAVTGLTPETVRKVSDALYGVGVPATFFLQTGTIGLSGITQKIIMTLIADGFDLQSAAHSGDDLRSLTNAQVKLEVEQSRKLIEEQTGKPVYAIDYPQGGVNDRVAKIVADAGYLFGLGNAPDKEFLRDQFLRLPSFNIVGSMAAEDIVNIIK